MQSTTKRVRARIVVCGLPARRPQVRVGVEQIGGGERAFALKFARFSAL